MLDAAAPGPVPDVFAAASRRPAEIDRARLDPDRHHRGSGCIDLLAWLAGRRRRLRRDTTLGPRSPMRRSRCSPSSSRLRLGLGIIVGSVFLMPAVTALVASFFVDDIALAVERSRYPGEPEGKPPAARARRHRGGAHRARWRSWSIWWRCRSCRSPGFGAFIFFFCTAYILGREYFELAAHALPRRPRRPARCAGGIPASVFVAGMFIAAAVSIPVLNLATPLFGMAFMARFAQAPVKGAPRRGRSRRGAAAPRDGRGRRLAERRPDSVSFTAAAGSADWRGLHGSAGGHVRGVPKDPGASRQLLLRHPRSDREADLGLRKYESPRDRHAWPALPACI